jgi:hypothetical protein
VCSAYTATGSTLCAWISSVEQNLSSDADGRSVGLEIPPPPRILWSWKVNCHVHKTLPLDPILSHTNPICKYTPYFMIHFNIILAYTPRYPQISFLQGFQTKCCVHFTSLLRTYGLIIQAILGSTSHSDCVSVALLIQHAMHMFRIILWPGACLALP